MGEEWWCIPIVRKPQMLACLIDGELLGCVTSAEVGVASLLMQMIEDWELRARSTTLSWL